MPERGLDEDDFGSARGSYRSKDSNEIIYVLEQQAARPDTISAPPSSKQDKSIDGGSSTAGASTKAGRAAAGPTLDGVQSKGMNGSSSAKPSREKARVRLTQEIVQDAFSATVRI